MTRLPIRLRVTAAFALAMAAVLAGSGLYLYLQLGSHLAASLDRDLRLRAQDIAALIRPGEVALARDNTGRLIERGSNTALPFRIISSAKFSAIANPSSPGQNRKLDDSDLPPASNTCFGAGLNRPPV